MAPGDFGQARTSRTATCRKSSNETGTTREDLGLKSFRSRYMDTTNLLKRAEDKAKTILEMSKRSNSKQQQEAGKRKTACLV
jgi:hypothetical protein